MVFETREGLMLIEKRVKIEKIGPPPGTGGVIQLQSREE